MKKITNGLLSQAIYLAFYSTDLAMGLMEHGESWDKLRECHIILADLHRKFCDLSRDEQQPCEER